ncbi:lipopolysaccharide transport periplasmic protein LptA [Porticoccaceae bacterium LTM1]|nr:lipopolysaccharide transport periplasmic protein LptA [Porticoccaceae bacterium LTM1]
MKWIVIPALSVTMGATGAIALQNDLKERIKAEADLYELNDLEHITTYTGSVIITQGSIRIEADTVTVKWAVNHETNERTIESLTCNGQPARFQQEINPEEGLVVATANTIFYDHSNEKIELTKDANITREDGSLLTSDSILYDLSTGGMSAGKNERVKTVFPPQKQKEEKDGDS